MTTARPAPRRPRRGRRSGTTQTRAELLAAARAEFTQAGYGGATVRKIARRAQVDPAMINYLFGGKTGLFAAAMPTPVEPEQLASAVLTGDRTQLGQRLVQTVLTHCDTAAGDPLLALLRSLTSHEQAAAMFRTLITDTLFQPVARALQPDHPDLRAALCAAQLAGLALTRYIIQLEPLASADHNTLSAAIAPTLQTYLTAPLPPTTPPTTRTANRSTAPRAGTATPHRHQRSATRNL